MFIVSKYIENEKIKLQKNINNWNDSILSIKNNKINNFTKEQKDNAIKSIEKNINILQHELNEIELYKNNELLLKIIINKIDKLKFYINLLIIYIIIISYYNFVKIY
jgi:hypothetical protein